MRYLGLVLMIVLLLRIFVFAKNLLKEDKGTTLTQLGSVATFLIFFVSVAYFGLWMGHYNWASAILVWAYLGWLGHTGAIWWGGGYWAPEGVLCSTALGPIWLLMSIRFMTCPHH